MKPISERLRDMVLADATRWTPAELVLINEARAACAAKDRFDPKDEALLRIALVDMSKNMDHDLETRNRAYAMFQVLRQEVGEQRG